jgi:hypothetical protein
MLSLHRLTSYTLLYSSSLVLYSCCLMLQLRNSAHLYRRGMDTQHRKHMSRDSYPLLCDVTALHSNGPIREHIENTASLLLIECMLRALRSNGFTLQYEPVRCTYFQKQN